MVQTLAIGLEKQKDQPTPSKALPKLSLSLSFSRGPHKVCGRGTRCPQLLYHGGNPITGAPSLEGSPSRRTKKVHSDLLSSSLSGQSAPKLSQALTGVEEDQVDRESWLPSLCGPEPRVHSLSIMYTLSASVCKGACHLYMEEPSPWEAPLVGCKEHLQRQSEGGGELPPETLRGET